MNHDTQQLRTASVTAGLALALMTVVAPLSAFGAIDALVVPGDAARTVQNIADSPSLFRLGAAGLVLVVILDVVVAIGLLTLFRPVSRGVAIMAAAFRLVYAAVYLVAIVQLVLALGLLGDPALAMRAIDAYDAIWHVGLVLCGAHLVLIGYLAYRSGYMAKVFGILLVVAGIGYAVDAFGAVLVAGYALDVGRFTFVGEAALIFWLLIKGSRKDFRRSETDRELRLDQGSLVNTPAR